MTIYEPLFLLIALISIIVLITAAVKGIGGSGKSALRLLCIWAACVSDLLSGFVWSSRHVRRETIAANRGASLFRRLVHSDRRSDPRNRGKFGKFEATIRIFSEAKRVTQREKSVTVLLEDAAGNRTESLPAAAGEPRYDTQLGPGQSVTTRPISNAGGSAAGGSGDCTHRISDGMAGDRRRTKYFSQGTDHSFLRVGEEKRGEERKRREENGRDSIFMNRARNNFLSLLILPTRHAIRCVWNSGGIELFFEFRHVVHELVQRGLNSGELVASDFVIAHLRAGWF